MAVHGTASTRPFNGTCTWALHGPSASIGRGWVVDTPTLTPAKRGSHITPTHLERGGHTSHRHTWGERDHTPHRHTWKEGVTHQRESHIIPTHLERGGHTSHPHIWKEGVTHHTDTPGKGGVPHHTETPGKRGAGKRGITHHTDIPGKRGIKHHTNIPGKRDHTSHRCTPGVNRE